MTYTSSASTKPLTKEEIEKITSMPVSAAYPTAASTGHLVGTLGKLFIEGNRRKVISDLVNDGYWIKMTGSRVTKDGWTDDSDWDYVVYDPDQKLQDVYKQIDGWVLGSDAGQGEFASIRKHDVNLILVSQEEIWKKYIIATNLIKTLNSKTKEERIAVFDSVFGKDSNAKAVEF